MGTRIDVALEHAESILVNPASGNRKDALDVVLLLTDGETDPGKLKLWKTYC